MKRCLQNVSLCFLLLAASAAQAAPPPAALVECLKRAEGDQSSQLSTYQDFVHGHATRLTLRSGWWSEKKSIFDLSIVTGLTVSRLDQLEAQCRAWKGPLTAAVYLVVHVPPGSTKLDGAGLETVHKAEKDMAEFHKRMEALPNGCSLNMMLLVETVADRIMRWMLPINVLRNYALLGADTRLVAMVDVDLLPSVGLADWLQLPGKMDWLRQECSQKKLFVLPAFETAELPTMAAAHKVAAKAAASDKQALQKMVAEQQVWQFALKIFREGHNMTLYDKWFNSSEAYGPLGWTKDYEPWFIIDRTLTPFYDSVFRGYGWNKVTHVTHVHHQGFKFMVHPTGFLVHRQHGYTKARDSYQSSKASYEKTLLTNKAKARADKSLAATTHKFRDRVLVQLSEGRYKPALDTGLQMCLDTLPWWKQNSSKVVAPAQAVEVSAAQRHQRRRRRRQLEQPAHPRR